MMVASLVFLNLLIPHGGPNLLQSILYVLKDDPGVQNLIGNVYNIHDIDLQDKDISVWVSVLKHQKDTLFHFFKQLEFLRDYTPLKKFCLHKYPTGTRFFPMMYRNNSVTIL